MQAQGWVEDKIKMALDMHKAKDKSNVASQNVPSRLSIRNFLNIIYETMLQIYRTILYMGKQAFQACYV